MLETTALTFLTGSYGSSSLNKQLMVSANTTEIYMSAFDSNGSSVIDTSTLTVYGKRK
jgi:DNA-binding beta-propeller fold protein YncE